MKRQFVIGVGVTLYALAFSAFAAEETPVGATACAESWVTARSLTAKFRRMNRDWMRPFVSCD